jgi:protocatechuate 3,4-dioxygenase beta subunit
MIACASDHELLDKYIANCHITPKVTPIDTYPGRTAIIPSNKLVLPAGKSVYASGQLLYISGRVFDENCVPVSDAIVDIWQANPEGKYVHASLGQRLTPYPTFAGSGRAITDNLGRFTFFTLFPGTYDNRAPHIHFHVIAKDFPTLETEMFFADDRRNAADTSLAHLAPDLQQYVMAKVWQRDANDASKGLGAQWDITLQGKNRYRQF